MCVSGGQDGLVVIWDMRRAAAHHVLQGDQEAILCVAVDEEVRITIHKCIK